MVSSTTPPGDGPWIDDWLSPARFATYVQACAGDRARALALYEWNTTVAQAFGRDLGHLEVAVRNAYDRAISARWRGQQHWLLDPRGPVQAPLMRSGVDVNARNRAQVVDAVARAGGPSAPPGKVIAELSFGWWRYLTSRAHEKTLWVRYLHRAYPPRTSRARVDRAARSLLQLRNRVAHMESLISRPLQADHVDLLWLCEQLNPELADFVRCASTVPELLRSRP